MRNGVRRALKIAVAALCLAALAGGAAVLIQRKKAALADAPRYGLTPTPVRAATARSGSLQITRDYLAIVEPAQIANLTARVTSQVESVAVYTGQIVNAHHPLILLDDREIADAIVVAQAQIAQAEAELDANKATAGALRRSAAFWGREADRMRQLLTSGAATTYETEVTIDKADQVAGQLRAAEHKTRALEHQIDVLASQVLELRTRLSYFVIASPFDGVVSYRYVDPGDQAAPGKTLLVVEDRSHAKLAFDVPQQDMPHLRIDLAVQFSVGQDQRSATVTNIFPSLNQARLLRAEIMLDGPAAQGLDSGAYLPLTVVLETLRDVILVPAAAVVEAPTGRPHVFLVSGGRLRPVEVTILGRSGDDVAVEGIEADVDVVLSTFLGWSRLSAGLVVEAVR